MLGKPKFNYGDEVKFVLDGIELTGKVEIIDRWGTFFDDSDVSYDVMVEHHPRFNGEPCLCKHLPEKMLYV